MISKIFKNFINKSEFLKNVATLVSGSLLAQMIPFFLAPVVARLYYPSDYAVLAAYTSISVLLTIVATGMYDSAVMLDATDEEALNTAGVAVSITSIISIFSVIIIIFFKDIIAGFTGNENVTFWLYLIPLTVFFSGFYNTLTVWTNRKKRYKRLAVNRVIQTFCTTGLTVILGFAKYREKGLMISMIAGQAIAFLLLFYQTLKDENTLIYTINFKMIKISFRKHIDFPKYNLPQGFLDGIKESSVVLIISNFYGANALGSFAFAKNILLRPLQMIGSAVSQIFYEKASYIFNQTGDIFNLSKKTFLMLIFTGLPFVILIVFLGSDIFGFIFGIKWKGAGTLSQVLIPWLFLQFAVSPLGTIPLIMNQQKKALFFSILSNFIPLILLLILGYTGFNLIPSLIFFTILSFLTLSFIVIWIFKLIHHVT